MDSNPFLESPRSNASSKKQNVGITLIVVLVLLCIGLFFTEFVTTQRLQDDIAEVSDKVHNIGALPKKFATEYLTSIRDQFHRGTCWAFAAVATLESHYMKQGHREGFLKDGQYVKMSEQSYAMNIIEYCVAHPDRCPDTPKTLKEYNTDDGYIKWIWNFQKELSTKILPDICEYQKDNNATTNRKCDGRDSALKSNPIKYEADLVNTAYTVDEVKRALLKNKAVPVVVELALTPYYIPCEGPFADIPQCVNEEIKCPPDVGTGFCLLIEALTDDLGHFFFASKTGHNLRPVGGHAMAAVGYNDDYVFYNNEGEYFKGGFIIKNSWGPEVSHSVAHYLNLGTYRHEDQICPNERAFSKWVPCGNNPKGGDDYYKLKNTTVLRCAPEGDMPGHLHVNVGDLNLGKQGKKNLESIKNHVCQTGYNYCVDRTTTVSNGAVEVVMKKWKESEQYKDAESFTLPQLPPLALSGIFKPVNAKKNNGTHCGYYFIPYSVWEETYSRWMAWALDMDIKFEAQSYASQKAKHSGKKFDWSHIEKHSYFINDGYEPLERPVSPTPWLSEVFN